MSICGVMLENRDIQRQIRQFGEVDSEVRYHKSRGDRRRHPVRAKFKVPREFGESCRIEEEKRSWRRELLMLMIRGVVEREVMRKPANASIKRLPVDRKQ